MEITRRVIDDKTCVVALDGTLNASSAPEVNEIFHQPVADEGIRQVVLNLQRMHSIDSSGLAAQISGLKAMNAVRGSLKMAALQSQADHLFKFTMSDQLFDIFHDAHKAIRSFPS